jgi:hypothetical protein
MSIGSHFKSSPFFTKYRYLAYAGADRDLDMEISASEALELLDALY